MHCTSLPYYYFFIMSISIIQGDKNDVRLMAYEVEN